MDRPMMSKRMRMMLIIVGSIIFLILLYKLFVGFMIKRAMAAHKDIVAVSVAKIDYSQWQPKLTASGSLRAIHGVNVTTELAGMVQTIYFTPGANVKQGDVLVQLNADSEIGQMQSLQAQVALAELTYNRDKVQFAVHAVSKQVLDTDYQNWQSVKGQLAQQTAIVAKKRIVAPFTGRLGVNNINLGQFVNPGDVIVMLQTLHPIWADFYFPQQNLSQLKLGLSVTVYSDAFPNRKFEGKITTINPGVDTSTRNVLVEATIENEDYVLAPGMFVTGEIYYGKQQPFLTLPQTAVSFNPYGDIVYIVREYGKDKKGEPILNATQRFVTVGETRGDQIMILKGLNKGDTVVTSGQLKLKNGSQVTINNSIVPSNNPAPELPNNH